MAGELVERLRKLARNHERGFPQALLYTRLHQEAELAAAARIEALERENSTLRAERAILIEEAARIAEEDVGGVELERFISNGVAAKNSKGHDLFISTEHASALLHRRAAAIRNMGGEG